jgi:hypothetical protein
MADAEDLTMDYIKFKRIVLDLLMKRAFPADVYLGNLIPIPVLRAKLHEMDSTLSDAAFQEYLLRMWRQNAVQLNEADQHQDGELLDINGHQFYYVC